MAVNAVLTLTRAHKATKILLHEMHCTKTDFPSDSGHQFFVRCGPATFCLAVVSVVTYIARIRPHSNV